MSEFVCAICGKTYKTESWYDKHMLTHETAVEEQQQEPVEEQQVPAPAVRKVTEEDKKKVRGILKNWLFGRRKRKV